MQFIDGTLALFYSFEIATDKPQNIPKLPLLYPEDPWPIFVGSGSSFDGLHVHICVEIYGFMIYGCIWLIWQMNYLIFGLIWIYDHFWPWYNCLKLMDSLSSESKSRQFHCQKTSVMQDPIFSSTPQHGFFCSPSAQEKHMAHMTQPPVLCRPPVCPPAQWRCGTRNWTEPTGASGL